MHCFVLFKIISPLQKSIYCLANKHIMHKSNFQMDIIEESMSLLAEDHFLLTQQLWWWKAVYSVWYITHYICYIVREWRYGQMGSQEKAGIQILMHLLPTCTWFFFFSLIKIGNWFVLIKVILVHKDIAIILAKFYSDSYLTVFVTCVNNYNNWLYFNIKITFH